MNETIIGIFIGAVITFMLNYLLESSKHKMSIKKYNYDIKRNKLEEFYILIENSIKFSVNSTLRMSLILYHGKESANKMEFNHTADDFIKLTNIINMYFSDDEILIKLINKANNEFKKGQEVNGIIYTGKSKNKDETNNMLIKEWKQFGETANQIKKEIPRLYQSLIT
ncbi:hypothetical protein [Sulfurimonas sp.]|uniref:hypothetical protein n=1 Tax=Sulfurimonas sp. TaxID=2022749 RepID=UPI0025E238A3|nr:hypothetical protein [Sulfurimonas sp.]